MRRDPADIPELADWQRHGTAISVDVRTGKVSTSLGRFVCVDCGASPDQLLSVEGWREAPLCMVCVTKRIAKHLPADPLQGRRTDQRDFSQKVGTWCLLGFAAGLGWIALVNWLLPRLGR